MREQRSFGSPTVRHMLVGVAALTLSSTVVHSEAVPDDLAKALDPSITEIKTAGQWEAEGRKGSYRAIVVMAGGATKRIAKAYVQWIAPAKDGAAFEVVTTMPIQVFNDLLVDNAELALDSEKTSEATLQVQSYDPAKDTDQSITVTLGLPGAMKVEPPSPSE
jgi:hypothetical protein